MIAKRWIPGASFFVVATVFLLSFVLKEPTAEIPEDPGSGAAGSARARDATPAEEMPISVKAAAVRRGELVVRLRSSGEAVTDSKVVLRTEVGGIVREIRAREGLRVRGGDLLVRLDDERFRLALERQEASRLRLVSEMLLEKRFGQFADRPGAAAEKIAKAREDFAAAEADFRQGAISQSDFAAAVQDHELALIESGMRKDEVMAAAKGLTQAEIDVRTARLDLQKTSIRAPFDGVVTEIMISPGEQLEPGRDLLTLVGLRGLKVIARVLESEVGRLKAGREVGLRFSAWPEVDFRGRVEAVSPVVNPGDRTCAVHVAVENPQDKIKPGMHAEVEIAAEVHEGRLLVPRDAVLVREGRTLVFTVEGGLAKWRYVEVGLENENQVEVLDGLGEGERVIVEGHFTLAQDAPVSVVD
jgi:multidrug efflux pump subunit AcrA (membrane-fusion protein)